MEQTSYELLINNIDPQKAILETEMPFLHLIPSHINLVGAEIDYIDSFEGSQFTIKNPNAQTTCGCGSSFSV
jgi:iron-sulfur cluster assembly accessory protein